MTKQEQLIKSILREIKLVEGSVDRFGLMLKEDKTSLFLYEYVLGQNDAVLMGLYKSIDILNNLEFISRKDCNYLKIEIENVSNKIYKIKN